MDTGTIIITEAIDEPGISQLSTKVAIYTHFQPQRIKKTWKVRRNACKTTARPKLLKLVNDPNVTLIVVEHKDRLTRFGYNSKRKTERIIAELAEPSVARVAEQ